MASRLEMDVVVSLKGVAASSIPANPLGTLLLAPRVSPTHQDRRHAEAVYRRTRALTLMENQFAAGIGRTQGRVLTRAHMIQDGAMSPELPVRLRRPILAVLRMLRRSATRTLMPMRGAGEAGEERHGTPVQPHLIVKR